MLQLKAMDDAICKAEEQVEKFTEMAKETKVLLCDLKKKWLFFIARIFIIGLYFFRVIFKNLCLPAGEPFFNQSERHPVSSANQGRTATGVLGFPALCRIARFPALAAGFL